MNDKTMEELIIRALRVQPKTIIVGEIRDDNLLKALMNVGYEVNSPISKKQSP